MNIIIWPADKLVLKRTIKVNGRISILNNSIIGKIKASPIGVP